MFSRAQGGNTCIVTKRPMTSEYQVNKGFEIAFIFRISVFKIYIRLVKHVPMRFHHYLGKEEAAHMAQAWHVGVSVQDVASLIHFLELDQEQQQYNCHLHTPAWITCLICTLCKFYKEQPDSDYKRHHDHPLQSRM